MKNESGYRYFNRLITQNCTAGNDRSKAKKRKNGKRRKTSHRQRFNCRQPL